ncbi:melatonin receptor type 1B-A-like [Amphiura filiformis]|uniref:melatonin receptor type 1B-A-like n=1 Tax=Amphiura filiformis TaxID=82378 RepID=UPI003B20E983
MEQHSSTTANETHGFNSTTFQESNSLHQMTIHYIERVFSGIVILIIILLGCVGNALIIISVIMSRKLRTSTNIFVVSLSTADIMTSLALSAFLLPRFHSSGWPLPNHEWLCSGSAFIVFTCNGASLYNLAAIAVNRLLLIIRPTLYKKVYTPLHSTLMVITIWFIPMSICLFLPLAGIGGFGFDSTDFTCSDQDDHPKAGVFNMAQIVSVFPIPLILITVSYTWIGCHVKAHFKRQLQNELDNFAERTHEQQSHHQRTGRQENIKREQLEITKNLFTVVCIFFICYLPYFIISVIPGWTHAVYYLKLLVLANSSLNPIVYSYKHPHFKDVIGKLLHCRYADIPEPSHILQSIRQRSAVIEPSRSN